MNNIGKRWLELTKKARHGSLSLSLSSLKLDDRA